MCLLKPIYLWLTKFVLENVLKKKTTLFFMSILVKKPYQSKCTPKILVIAQFPNYWNY